MFGFRTPAKDSQRSVTRHSPEGIAPARMEGESSRSSGVRRSIGEWESGKPDAHLRTPPSPKESVLAVPPKLKPKSATSHEGKIAARKASVEAAGSPPVPVRQKYLDRLSEAKACVTKAKIHLGHSRNLKSEIKTEVIAAIDRLFQLVKEAESAKGSGKKVLEKEPEPEKGPELSVPSSGSGLGKESELEKCLEEHAKLMRQSNQKIEKLQETIEKQAEKQTYASVAAAPVARPASEQTALHSVVVTAIDESETGEEVLNRIRTAVNAKEGGVTVERIRKAKDRKVIVGCRTEEERKMFVERLKGAEQHLRVEEMKNKDPLVILKDVFTYNSDEDVLSALRIQNKGIFADGLEHRLEIAYKKRTRNPHTHHVVLRVSPHIWQQMTVMGSVLVDLQRVRVADQSPLVQCSLCLGYGHGRRHCTTTLEKCSHCGGPHMRADCADWLANAPPACCNCTSAKIGKVDHNAFSTECPVRRKWDALARATIGYQC